MAGMDSKVHQGTAAPSNNPLSSDSWGALSRTGVVVPASSTCCGRRPAHGVRRALGHGRDGRLWADIQKSGLGCDCPSAGIEVDLVLDIPGGDDVGVKLWQGLR